MVEIYGNTSTQVAIQVTEMTKVYVIDDKSMAGTRVSLCLYSSHNEGFADC